MNLRESLEVVKKHWNTIPVPVEKIASELGLNVRYDALPDNISGAIVKSDAGYYILVNRTHAPTRRRFTVAHEIGHFIYHRDLLGEGTGDTRAYRADGTPFPNRKITEVQERQANTFAANLLMPNHLIKRLQAQGILSPEELAKSLQVSPEAMRIKLGMKKTEFVKEPSEDDVEIIHHD